MITPSAPVPPPGRGEARRIRCHQLCLLRRLAMCNHRLAVPGLPVREALAQLAESGTVFDELREWTVLLERYAAMGLDTAGPRLADLVGRAMRRAGRGNARLAGRLEALLGDLPLRAPVLRFSADGRLLPAPGGDA